MIKGQVLKKEILWEEILQYYSFTQLGPNARFYHALTVDEEKRVENLLKEDEREENWFSVDHLEIERLQSIDGKLCKIVPELEWETKSLVLPLQSSGVQTPPLSFLKHRKSSDLNSDHNIRAVDVVLKSITQQDPFGQEKKRMCEIDEALLRIRSMPPEVIVSQLA
jgi:hypothetical protein